MGGQQPNLTTNERRALAELASLMEAHAGWFLELQRGVVADLPPAITPPETDMSSEMEASITEMRSLAEGGDYGQYLETRRARMAQMTQVGLSFGLIVQAISALRDPLVGLIRREIAERSRAYEVEDVMDHLITDTLVMAGEVFAAVKEEQTADEYRLAIRRLSTPVVKVWDEILLLPVIGIVDSERSQQMMEQILNRIVEEQARVVIIDVTGVPTLDTAVADHLIKTTKAASLLGARTLLVGISPEVAQTVVKLGVSLADMDAHADLRRGLEHALETLGYAIRER